MQPAGKAVMAHACFMYKLINAKVLIPQVCQDYFSKSTDKNLILNRMLAHGDIF
jgi:hypothetical protein